MSDNYTPATEQVLDNYIEGMSAFYGDHGQAEYARQFDRWLAAHDRETWRAGFRAGWESSGEGYNGEYPDEGVPWTESAGYERMLDLDGGERIGATDGSA